MMKRSFKSIKTILGVTLLEIMLVLAIAAMVVVMSIRYYQSASMNQRVAATVSTISAIVAAGESYFAAIGNFSSIDTTALANYMPGGMMPTTAWGGTISIVKKTASTYEIDTANVPAVACKQLAGFINQNTKTVMDNTDCAKTQVSAY